MIAVESIEYDSDSSAESPEDTEDPLDKAEEN